MTILRKKSKKVAPAAQRFRLIPNLPDVVLRHLFSLFNYHQLCRLEIACKRQRMRVLFDELVIEQQYKQPISINELRPLRRLMVRCDFTTAESLDVLSGIMRRHRTVITRITCDLRFLAQIDQLHIADREPKRKYMSNVDDCWLFLSQLDDDIVRRFIDIESSLFLNLSNLTIQLHASRPCHERNIGQVLSALTTRHTSLTLRVEIQAVTESMIMQMLSAFHDCRLEHLKAICVEFDRPTLSLSTLRLALARHHVRVERLTLRDWRLVAATKPTMRWRRGELIELRISSCTIDNLDRLVDAMRSATALRRVELAGYSTLVGYDFLADKAHIEFERKFSRAMPHLIIDCNEIYYWH